MHFKVGPVPMVMHQGSRMTGLYRVPTIEALGWWMQVEQSLHILMFERGRSIDLGYELVHMAGLE